MGKVNGGVFSSSAYKSESAYLHHKITPPALLISTVTKNPFQKSMIQNWLGINSTNEIISMLRPRLSYCEQFDVVVFLYTFSCEFLQVFYPTALKGYRGIVFTHGVRMGGQGAGSGKKFVRAISRKL